MKRLLILLLFTALWTSPMWAASKVITTNGDVLTVGLPQDKGGATLTISGTWTGTITFEGSGDGGTTWTALSCMPFGSTTPATSATAVGSWQRNISGFTGVRMRASASITGSAIVTITPSAAAAP